MPKSFRPPKFGIIAMALQGWSPGSRSPQTARNRSQLREGVTYELELFGLRWKSERLSRPEASLHNQPRPRAVIWVHWGHSYLSLLERSVRSAATHVDADRYVISDAPIPASIPAKNIIYPFTAAGFMRKPEALSQIVPDGHSVLLFLDSDTVVLDNIDFGFEQASKHGLAILGCYGVFGQ